MRYLPPLPIVVMTRALRRLLNRITLGLEGPASSFRFLPTHPPIGIEAKR